MNVSRKIGENSFLQNWIKFEFISLQNKFSPILIHNFSSDYRIIILII